MKTLAKILMVMALVFGAVSCNSIDKSEFDISQNFKGGEQRENIARVIASMEIDKAEVSKIHAGVLKALEEGLHETYFMKELMCEDSKIVKSENQTSAFVDYIENLENKDDSLTQLLDYYNEGNNANILQIYWPFSENWDGKTKPVITFLPEDKAQATNKAYYMEDGELKSVEVDRNYAMSHPVWIINESSLGYNNIPDFNNNNRKGDYINIVPRKVISVIKPKFSPSYGMIYMTKMRAVHDHNTMFFCESITYTFVLSLPEENDYAKSCELVVTMSESELNSQEFRIIQYGEHIGIEEFVYESTIHSNLHLSISREVNPRTILRPQPFLINTDLGLTEVLSTIEIAEEQSLYYETMIDVDSIIPNGEYGTMFSYGELEWYIIKSLYTGY